MGGVKYLGYGVALMFEKETCSGLLFSFLYYGATTVANVSQLST